MNHNILASGRRAFVFHSRNQAKHPQDRPSLPRPTIAPDKGTDHLIRHLFLVPLSLNIKTLLCIYNSVINFTVIITYRNTHKPVKRNQAWPIQQINKCYPVVSWVKTVCRSVHTADCHPHGHKTVTLQERGNFRVTIILYSWIRWKSKILMNQGSFWP